MVAPPQASSSCARRGAPALGGGRLAFGRDRGGVGQELVGDAGLFRVPAGAHRGLAAFGDQRAVAGANFSTWRT